MSRSSHCFDENESPYPLRSETSEVIIDFSYNIFIDGWDDLDKALKQFEIEMTRFVADSILACKGGSRRSLRFLDDKHGFGLKTRRRLGESILCLDSLPKDEKCKFQSASFIFNMYFLRFLLLSLLI